MRTRSFALDVPEKENEPQIMHTLLGVELKVGKKRIACPDLSHARYLAVFARIGCKEVAVPYDITSLSAVADNLETSWHRLKLLFFDTAVEKTPSASQGRVWAAVVRAMRSEIGAVGAGTKMPLFNRSTKQWTN